MCLSSIRTYTKKHHILTLICLGLFLMSILLTSLVLWGTTQRALFITETNGTRVAIHHINLDTSHMVPDALSIKVGEYVQFNTADGRTHEIGLGGGEEYQKNHEHTDPEFESSTFGNAEAYRVKFSKPGIYDFHDHLHSELFATVIVS